MPNRILREGILSSDRVNSLTCEQEVFYRRLMSIVDDFGRYDARPSILRAALYPLQLDTTTEKVITQRLEAVAKAGLIILYSVDKKPYLELLDFRQQVRAKASRWPSSDSQMRSTCVADAQHMKSYAHLDGVGVGVEVEDGDGDGGESAARLLIDEFATTDSEDRMALELAVYKCRQQEYTIPEIRMALLTINNGHRHISNIAAYLPKTCQGIRKEITSGKAPPLPELVHAATWEDPLK